ncbi:MAG: GNAT family N-acyltransferase [Xanthomonadaceae bacterium]|nr:GNAT family N-acyltransferase [Xanthomonadaceae bacterium]
MIDVKESFYSRFPQLAEGPGQVIGRPVVGLLRQMVGEEPLNRLLANLDGRVGFDYVDCALKCLDARYRVALTDLENIPAEGRLLIVSNHPLGAIDALALLQLVGSVRRDVKILANQVLMQLRGLAPLLVPCDVFGGGGRQVREAYRALDREEALIVFPAGEVSRLSPSGIRDGRWSEGFLRFARKSGAAVLPIHIAARNSSTFYGVSMLAKPLATLMLPREMFGRDRSHITITVGGTVDTGALFSSALDDRLVAQRMRAHVYRLGKRKPPMFATSSAIAHSESPAAVRSALQSARNLGKTSDGQHIVLLDPTTDDAALREIGRLRELTFRRVAEGTGLRRDLDRYDAWYRHVVLWDDSASTIAGAYRLGEARRILSERGRDGLYSASLFDYSPRATSLLRSAVELGRSFVHPDYQGGRSLDYLWQGIGAYLRAYPEVRYLIGPVSLSVSLGEVARSWIVHFHQHYYGDSEGLASARNPYRVDPAVALRAAELWKGLDVRAGLIELKRQLATLGASLPMLYKQYADVCEPDGVRFLAFGVDPAFGHCVDGLVCLDLTRIKASKKVRYLAGPRGLSAQTTDQK